MTRTARTMMFSAAALVGLALVPASGLAQRTARPVPVSETTTSPGGIVVIVRGLRNDQGQLIGGLYDQAQSWLGENASREDCHARIHHGVARCVFHATVTGRVAFAGLHDEDGDGEMDRDMVGIPSEGYAFSNDVREPFGPPSFDAASFSSDSGAPVVVHARYGI
ncbi:MAG: DUF2141 domain-containing protein [Sandaracinus sp.]